MNTQEKLTGVWLDNREAIIIKLDGDQENSSRVKSDVKSGKSKGGTGMRTPYGPQDGVSESKVLERRKHQFQQYYEDIIEAIKESDQLYIIGPAEAKTGLSKLIQSKPELRNKLLKVETCDSMTLNQLKAKVKNFFVED